MRSQLLLLLCWTGCVQTNEDPWADLDHDGYRAAEDCDDGDPRTYPGAVELCDEIDQDCDGSTELGDGASLWYADEDGDGWGDDHHYGTRCAPESGWIARNGDCDDDDETISPDATETCDGVDQDCDGRIDDEPSDGLRRWRDEDGDGWGDPDGAALVCPDEPGWADNDGDCLDGDADANPDETERCDDGDIDEDCDGLADDDDPDAIGQTAYYRDADRDGVARDSPPVFACDSPWGYADTLGDCDDTDDTIGASLWYLDLDGDGYGADGAIYAGCPAPPGAVPLAGDCDDRDPDQHPGAVETWYDGTDQDCDDADDWDADGDGDEAEAWGGGDCDDGDPSRSGHIDEIWGNELDEDCDGEAADYAARWDGETEDRAGTALAWSDSGEVAIAARTTGSRSDGRVYVLHAWADGDPSTADAVITGSSSLDLLDGALAWLPDVDGDGVEDLWVSSPQSSSSAGRVDLFLGPVDDARTLGDADGTLTGPSAWVRQGASLLNAGDIDDDGLSDAWIGASSLYTHGSRCVAARLLGADLAAATSLGDADTCLYWTASYAGDQAGSTLALGDMDGDGQDELAVGIPNYSTRSSQQWGAVITVNGGDLVANAGSLTLTSVAEEKVVSNRQDAKLGYDVLIEDLDGDGYGDLVVSAPTRDVGTLNQVGRLLVFAGPAAARTDDSDATLRIDGDVSDAEIGVSLDAVDLDGDGAPDLLIGAPSQDIAGSGSGAVWRVAGPLGTGHDDISELGAAVTGPETGAELGAALASHDGTVLAGAPGFGSTGEGLVVQLIDSTW